MLKRLIFVLSFSWHHDGDDDGHHTIAEFVGYHLSLLLRQSDLALALQCGQRAKWHSARRQKLVVCGFAAGYFFPEAMPREP